MRKILLAALCLIAPMITFGQLSLTEIPTSIPAYKTGFYDWSDFDNDGDQDLVIYGNASGSYQSKIYRNDGNFNFSETSITLPNANGGEIRWGDYNNDSKKDLLFSADNGGAPGNFSKIFKNINNQTFNDIQVPLPINLSNEGSGLSSIWSDLNNDGLLDVITKGYFSPCNYFFRVFRNNGNDSFSEAFSFTGTDNGRIISGDVDNDGLKDIAFQGFSFCNNPQGLTRILKNQGNFNFTDINAEIPGVLGVPNFVDFNNDGKLDIFVCGRVVGGLTAKLFINNLPTGYTESPIQFPAGEYFTEWHDFDSDGFKDVFFSVDTVFKIFHNDGGTGITEVTHNISVSGMPRILDLNGDGNMELFINQGTGSKLYSFQSPTANCPDLSGSLLQGLVGYWPFCGNANDESGNGNNGISNQMVWGTDRFGKPNSAAEYNGNIQRAIRVPNPVGATGGQFTFSFWLKASGPYSIYNGIIDAKGSGMYCNMYGPLQQYINNGIYGKLGFSGYLGNNPSTTSVNDSLWHHGVMVVDWPNGNVKIYVDGNLDATRTFAPQTINPWTAIDFGNSFDNLSNPSAAAEGVFGGSLDDIAIWNRALTPQEITQLYYQNICTQSITVTDTLLIHTTVTSWNPVKYANTLKVWPNPASPEPATSITLDAGNLSSMAGWKYKVTSNTGVAVVAETPIIQQQQIIPISSWGPYGVYFIYLIDANNIIQEVKKIVLAP